MPQLIYYEIFYFVFIAMMNLIIYQSIKILNSKLESQNSLISCHWSDDILSYLKKKTYKINLYCFRNLDIIYISSFLHTISLNLYFYKHIKVAALSAKVPVLQDLSKICIATQHFKATIF